MTQLVKQIEYVRSRAASAKPRSRFKIEREAELKRLMLKQLKAETKLDRKTA